jgi:ketosteroid isomerase-like protein
MTGSAQPPIAAEISPEQVRAEVRRFWKVYCSKSKDEFAELYFPEATVLEIDARRVEPALLMVARRARELFSPQASLNAKLGSIDVQVLEPGVAVASYGLHFHLVRVAANNKRFESDMPVTRVTHVFQRDQNGALRIIHEHMSAGRVSPPKELAGPTA